MIEKLLIAGIAVEIEHRYPLISWECGGYETDAPPQITVSASDKEIAEEYARTGGMFGMGESESNILYRKAALAMLDYDGFLLHSAAVAVDGMGYVFTAPGGTGKSTHINYWREVYGAEVINGDKPIIRKIGGKFHVCGTPWHGKERMGVAQNVPLKAVCLLERGSENAIERMDADAGADKLFRQLLPIEEPEYIIKQLDLLNELLSEVPIYRLKCTMSPEAARVAFEGMNGKKV